ncbi:MAG: leucyl aminopeptidase family protein [Emcibacter sp.]|nr:leucyl aminopeptidase family protein [Emcibacter sp.]
MILRNNAASYLTSVDYDKAIPIHIISPDTIEQWIETLDPLQSKWVRNNHFKADKNEILTLSNVDGDISAVAMGIGANDENFLSVSTDPWLLAPLIKKIPQGTYRLVGEENMKLPAIGWALAQYQFDRYMNKKSDQRLLLALQDEQQKAEAETIINAIILVRDLINTPTCDMGPSHLSDVTKELAACYGATFTETVGDDLLIKGYNSIHAVGKAASNQPRLLDMTWGRLDAPKITLVGKGVCFDTGGLDIKSSSGMRIMKKDMGGAAHTLGLAKIIMEKELDVRLRLLIPAVENNIAGNAFRPGDIIRTYKGTTVEVDNTDAEGRLVLCDALALASEENPELILDFATLTGAARVAMGPTIVPFFTDGDDIAANLDHASRTENDPLWRMPLYTPYMPQLKSNSADLSNMGSGPFGGAIIAALFLKHFIKEPKKWVHFDVYAWNMNDQPGRPQGGEAMALRAVYAYLHDRFSKKP